jgi:hypothetical protein
MRKPCPRTCGARVSPALGRPNAEQVFAYLSTPEIQQGRWRGGVRRFLR